MTVKQEDQSKIQEERMNPRRVHELMRAHFPSRPASASDWTVVIDQQGLRFPVLDDLVRRYIDADSLLVGANRKTAGFFPLAAALDFVHAHSNLGRLRITNRDFTGFVVVESNGVASGWTMTVHSSGVNSSRSTA